MGGGGGGGHGPHAPPPVPTPMQTDSSLFRDEPVRKRHATSFACAVDKNRKHIHLQLLENFGSLFLENTICNALLKIILEIIPDLLT